METQELLDKALRKAKTKDNLASAVAVSRRQVARWWNEGARPNARAYGALLKYVGVPLAEVRRLVGEREVE